MGLQDLRWPQKTRGLRITGLSLKLPWAAMVQCLVEPLAVVEHLGVNPSDTSSGNPVPFQRCLSNPGHLNLHLILRGCIPNIHYL